MRSVGQRFGVGGPFPGSAAPPRRAEPATSRGTGTSAAGQRLDALSVAVCLMLLTFVWRVQSLFGFLRPFKLLMISALAGLLFAGLNRDPHRRLAHLAHPIGWLMLAILALMLLLVPFSLLPSWAFSFTVNDHLKTVVLAAVVGFSIRSFKDLETLALVNVAGAVLYTVVAINSVQADSYYGLGDNLFYYDANDFAMVVVMTLPMAAYFLQKANRFGLRLFGLAGVAVLIYAIISSGSRGAFLALVGVGLYLLIGFRALSGSVRVMIGLFLTLGFLLVGSDRYWERMKTLLHPKEDYNWAGNQDTGRMEVWKRGIGYMVQFPSGLGPGNFERAEGRYAPRAQLQEFGVGWKWNSAHNSFVEIGAELGILGLGLFVSLLWVAFRTLKRISGRARDGPRRAADEVAMAQALIGSLIAYVIAGFFLSQAFAPYLYAILGMVVGFAAISRRVVPVPQAVKSVRTTASISKRPRRIPRRVRGHGVLPEAGR